MRPFVGEVGHRPSKPDTAAVPAADAVEDLIEARLLGDAAQLASLVSGKRIATRRGRREC